MTGMSAVVPVIRIVLMLFLSCQITNSAGGAMSRIKSMRVRNTPATVSPVAIAQRIVVFWGVVLVGMVIASANSVATKK